MQCPRTKSAMKEVDINGIKIDISEGCGGVWFDLFEFEKFDEPHESAGEQIIDLMEKYRQNTVDLGQRIYCPRHPDMIMRRHFFSVKKSVEIDECPECGGIWLDPGELAQLRALFPDETAKKAAAQAMIKELFDKDPEIRAMKEKSAKDLKRARRFANMFRYICPSYYIPGDQEWGAF